MPGPTPSRRTVSELAKRSAIRGQLSPAQRQAVGLFACGATVAVVAAETGVSPSTIRKWKNDDRFAREVDLACREIQQSVVRQLAARLPGVITSLADDAMDPALRPSERTAAAKVLLDRLPLSNVTAYETGAARQTARDDASPHPVETATLQAIWGMMTETARLNDANAQRVRASLEHPPIVGEIDP
ncbi:MAG: helix-turn-helix domain-containing protein [Sporichthyaceae bacterium]